MGDITSKSGCSLILIFTLFLSITLSSQTADIDGQWSAPIGFEIVPVAVANMPDGRLLTWAASSPTTFVEVSTGATYAEIFDPTIGTAGQPLGQFVSNTQHDMFCPGINLLPDGRIMAAGGASSDRVSIFDPNTELWGVADRMNIPRGYQGNVTLSDGSVFTLGGSWADGNSPSTNGQKDAELWSPLTGWFKLPGILGADIFTANDLNTEARGLYRVDNHLWLWAAPNGKIFHAGPSEEMHWIDVTGTGSVTSAGIRTGDTYSMKGTTVMFDQGKILKVGGAESYDSDHPAKDNAFVIDINNEASVTVVPTANSLEFSRTMLNSVVLPNGEVLVTGGLDQAKVFTDVGARFAGEIYSPVTNSWRTVAGMAEARTYHSVSILMSDGRVFVGGGGLCDGTPGCVNHQSAEIYSPPYLFAPGGALAARPAITTAPDLADYGDAIAVTTDVAVSEFSLIRFSGATHSTNNEQRRIPLTTVAGTSHSLTIPNRELLPPGYYMLFALDAQGVPSVSKSIKIGNAVPLAQNPNLVLDLDFEEGAGTLAADTSGNNNDATILERDNTGAAVPAQEYWGTGLFGSGALEMDGLEHNSNAIVEVANSTSMETIADQVTVMAWVYRNAGSVIPQTGKVANVGVMSHDYPAMFVGFHNTLYKWSFGADSFIDCYAGYAPVDTWVHITATYDGQTAKLYANGTEVCSKTVTGPLDLIDDGTVYSTFTTSGFYDDRATPVVPYGNQSGLTDELDGRMDELKVFNKALGAEEIKTFFQLGQQTGNPDVPDCPDGTITAEFKIGATGTWTQGNFITANEGDEVFIRAQTTGEYFITTHQVDGPTFSSTTTPEYQIDTGVNIIGVPPYNNPDRNNGLVDQSNNGLFALTTAGGCATVISLTVLGNCDPGETEISPEYNINGVWCNNTTRPCESEITINEGDALILSILPNTVPSFTIIDPDGIVYTGDQTFSAVTPTMSGRYTFVSNEGCNTTLDITVNEVDCATFGLETEYQINGTGGFISGESEVTIDSGNSITLSVLPNGAPFSLASNSVNGNSKALNTSDLTITNLDLDDEGLYTFTTGAGCEVTLNLIINEVDCAALGLVTEYRLNNTGNYTEGATEVTITQGNTLTLSVEPGGIPFAISSTSINGNSKPLNLADLDLVAIQPDDAGLYTFTTGSGCEVTLNVIVTEVDCATFGLQSEYQLNNTGPYIEGATEVNVDIGSTIILSVTPNGVPFSISSDAINANSKPFDLSDLTLSDLTLDDAGLYTFTTGAGCEVTLNVIVNEVDCTTFGLETEYQLNNAGDYITGESQVTVAFGSTITLSIIPNDTPFSITSDSPNGNSKPLDLTDLTLENLTLDDSGIYTFRTGAGCEVTLNLFVNCPSGPFTPEYTIDVVTNSGEDVITVDAGIQVSLSTVEKNVAFTITDPNGNTTSGDLDLGAITLDQGGAYIFTSAEGCSATLNIIVTDPCLPGSFTPEYTINGVVGSGEPLLTIDLGSTVSLGIVQDIEAFTITLPDATVVNGDYDLGEITFAQEGRYTFTFLPGCTASIDIFVSDPCEVDRFAPEYSIDGLVGSGEDEITVDEGTIVLLGLVQDGVDYSITSPDNSTVTNTVLDLGVISPAQAGAYIFSSPKGCEVTLTINVTPDDPCPPGNFTVEYDIDGVVDSGETGITIDAGATLILGITQDQNFTITLPDGSTNDGELNLGAVTIDQAGNYIFISEFGCTAEFLVSISPIVTPVDPDFKLKDVRVFPNPTTNGTVTFGLENYMNEKLFLTFYDIYGKLILREPVPETHPTEVTIDVSILSVGTYIVEIRRSSVDENALKKVIKRR